MTRQAASQMVARLREDGRRITQERRLLFDIIARNPHLDAAAIYDLARKRNPRIGLATVYRTLNLLAELDLVDVSTLGEGHSHYEIRGDDHVHLICLDCGRVREIPALPDLETLDEVEGFEVYQAHLELLGYCEACRKKRKAKREAEGASE